MAVTTRPQPATLPLPGGREGATVKVHPLIGAAMQAPPNYWDRGRGGPRAFASALLSRRSTWVRLPIPAFLVEHPEAGPILVDTAFHPDAASDPRRHLGRVAGAIYRVDTTPDQALPAQLRARGVDPADVGLVVMTHLHFDHASGVTQFPRATFVLDKAEWDAAAGGGLAQGYAHQLFDHPYDWRTLDFAKGEPHGPFSRTIDLLGDGSIRLLSTPGHTHGHLSLLCRLAGGELLLTADAAYARRNIDERLMPLVIGGREADYRASVAELAAYLEEHPETPAVCGHDPWDWPALERSYG